MIQEADWLTYKQGFIIKGWIILQFGEEKAEVGYDWDV